MLHTQLLRLINGRDAWAFVGSGPSIDAGCPSWSKLLESVRKGLDADEEDQLEADYFFKDSLDKGDLPAGFGVIEGVIGRQRLEEEARTSLAVVSTPGAMHRMLAELPFSGYITTNYDHLLEAALNQIDPGWAAVGNLGNEVRKASGTSERVVWHVHGSSELSTDKSKMILTQEDYDEIYLDGSAVHTQLRGLLAHRRVVVIGFGFRDLDVMQMLRRVGKMTDPERPIYAFVERGGDFRHQNGRDVFLRQYKVDVQPYRNPDGTHRNLRSLLQVYSSLSLRRSMKYGRRLAAPPSHDPETTGLLIYNEFVLSDHALDVPLDLKSAIVRSRVMAACGFHRRTEAQLRDDLQGVLQALAARVATPATDAQTEEALHRALSHLCDAGLLIETEGAYELTASGREVVLDHSASSDRLTDQFRASLQARLTSGFGLMADDANNAIAVIHGFFAQAITRRALGVALAFANGGSPQQEFHTLALLQGLRDWLDAAEDEAIALAVVETIEEVFRAPTAAEKTFIATGVQARFVMHLLSLDSDSLAIRRQELANSLFLIDASTLIPALARGSVGHDGARAAIDRLQDCGSLVATTWPLAEEVAEHARWAQKLLRDRGFQSTEVLAALTGRAGVKTNAFLQGFVGATDADGTYAGFDEYLAACLGVSEVANPANDAEIPIALERSGISVLDFEALAASEPRMSASSEGYFRQIKEGRQSAGTYRHDRQVRAEAEAVAVIAHIRTHGLDIKDRHVQNGHFITYTSLLDRIGASDLPVTLRPEAVISWLAAMRPVAKEDEQAIVSELLWELQERRMNIVDHQMLLRVFGPLVTAARERLEEVLPKYQALQTQSLGERPQALSEVDPLDAPVVLESALIDRLGQLEAELSKKERELSAARSLAEVTEADKKELQHAREKTKRRTKYERMMERRARRKKS